MSNSDSTVSTVLKSTDYVQVELRTNEMGRWFVSKKYCAHTAADRKRNATYSYMALRAFKDHFSDVLVSPEPILDGADEDETLMEYLPALPTAQRLNFETIHFAKGFFERCYELKNNLPNIETIYYSVMATPRLQRMIDDGWPLSLGLKCDLFENLRFDGNAILLADVDGLAYEPCGLSELVLHANLCASLKGFGRIYYYPKTISPVVFARLSSKKATEICNAAVEVFCNSVRDMPTWKKHIKIQLVKSWFRAARKAHYGSHG